MEGSGQCPPWNRPSLYNRSDRDFVMAHRASMIRAVAKRVSRACVDVPHSWPRGWEFQSWAMVRHTIRSGSGTFQQRLREGSGQLLGRTGEGMRVLSGVPERTGHCFRSPSGRQAHGQVRAWLPAAAGGTEPTCATNVRARGENHARDGFGRPSPSPSRFRTVCPTRGVEGSYFDHQGMPSGRGPRAKTTNSARPFPRLAIYDTSDPTRVV